MSRYDSATYGDKIASIYDQWIFVSEEETAAAADCLAALAGAGPALELGIGTGRVAIPLARKGIATEGVDSSAKMIDELRKKPGGGDIPVIFGDFSEVALDRQFSLVYVVFSTFYCLLTQEAQLRCFQNVARILAPGGVFVIEAFVPDPARFVQNQNVSSSLVGSDKARLDISRLDPLNQHVTSQSVILSEEGIRLYPVQIRYAWPSELDLMARIAGMRLRDRWSSWTRAPFTAASVKHISVYELVA